MQENIDWTDPRHPVVEERTVGTGCPHINVLVQKKLARLEGGGEAHGEVHNVVR